MPLKFGTSGVRGLVTDMTDQECYLYTKAFVQYAKSKSSLKSVAVAGDLRNSTPRIMQAVSYAVRDEGLLVEVCGFVATPAVMNYGVRNKAASVMVTGSHIPDDRNGIKFNMPWGEVLKADEAEISRLYNDLAGAGEGREAFDANGSFTGEPPGEEAATTDVAKRDYVRRFTAFFPEGCLSGMKVVFYQHSSVSRKILPEMLEGFGAEVVRVGFSDTFVPVDTEAVAEPEKLAAWVKEHHADALVSTDGDADRPLVVDEKGSVLRGDVLGILVSDFLGADAVATPISCNTALEKSRRFAHVARTRIGSPYVIEGMNQAVVEGYESVVGYEANGGFLTATDITDPKTGAVLPALPTRDAALPILAVLLLSKRRGQTMSRLVDDLPRRYTASGLLRGFPNEEGKAVVARFQSSGTTLANEVFSAAFGEVESMDFTDGARMTFVSGDIVHIRPSGNAPEFRVYTESSTEETAHRNNEIALGVVEELKGSRGGAT